MVLSSEIEAVESAAFAADELVVLAELVGSSRFPGVPDVHAALGSQARDAALTVARRGLVARGVVDVSGGGPALAAEYVDLLSLPLSAELVVAVERRDRERTYVRHYYAEPTSAVEHSLAARNVHRLTGFPATELAARALEFSGLAKRRGVVAAAFTTDADTFAALREGVRTGDLAEAREALGEAGSAFAAAMESFVAWCRVTVLRRGTAMVEGGETTWIDAGDALWRLEPAGSGRAPGNTIEISPCTARELADELVSHLSGEEKAA